MSLIKLPDSMNPIDDRISPDEAPIQKPYFQDIYGTAREQRPDTIIRNEVRKLQQMVRFNKTPTYYQERLQRLIDE